MRPVCAIPVDSGLHRSAVADVGDSPKAAEFRDRLVQRIRIRVDEKSRAGDNHRMVTESKTMLDPGTIATTVKAALSSLFSCTVASPIARSGGW